MKPDKKEEEYVRKDCQYKNMKELINEALYENNLRAKQL